MKIKLKNWVLVIELKPTQEHKDRLEKNARDWARRKNGVCTRCCCVVKNNPKTGKPYWECQECRKLRKEKWTKKK